MPLFGPPDIGKMKAKHDIKGLVKALAYTKAPEIRCTAAQYLGQLGDKSAVQPLILGLKDGSAAFREAVIKALEQLDASEAVPPLVSVALNDAQPAVRATAAKALGRIENGRGLNRLIDLLGDTQSNQRQKAVEALGMGGATALGPVLAALREASPTLRGTLVHVLDRLKWSPDQSEQAAIYWAIKRDWNRCAQVGAPAMEIMLAALQDKDFETCRAVILALEHFKDTRVVEALINILTQPGDLLRETAVYTLGQIGDRRAVEPLIEALSDRAPEVRRPAVEALEKIGDPRACDRLVAILMDEQEKTIQHAAARALSTLGWQPPTPEHEIVYWIALRRWDKCVEIGAPAVKRLVSVLKTGYSEDRQGAADALAQIGTPAIEELRPLLDSPDLKHRKAAGDVLKAIGWRPEPGGDELAFLISQRKWKQCAQRGAPAIQPLIAQLPKETSAARKSIIKALAEMGVPAIEALITDLRTGSLTPRKMAIEALEQIGGPDVIERLLPVLQNRNAEVSTAAADLLSTLKWRPDQSEHGAAYWAVRREWDRCAQYGDLAVGPLAIALGRENRTARREIAAILQKYPQDKRVVEPFITLLESDETKICLIAARVLGKAGDVRAVKPLIRLLKDSPGELLLAVVNALRLLKDAQAAGPLIETLGDSRRNIQEAAVAALIEIGAPAVEPLIGATGHDNVLVRQQVVEILGQIGDHRAVEPLLGILADQEPSVRQATANALGQIADCRAVEPLLPLLADPQAEMRRTVAESLEKLADHRAIEPLLRLLRDTDKDVRQSAARALYRLDWKPQTDQETAIYALARQDWDRCIRLGAAALDSLQFHLDDPDDNIRRAVIKTIGELKLAEAVPVLRERIDHHGADQETMVALMHALRRIQGNESILEYVTDLNYLRSYAAAQTLIDEDEGHLLLTTFRDATPAHQEAIATGLMTGKDAAVDFLIKSLNDKNLKEAALRAMYLMYRSERLSQKLMDQIKKHVIYKKRADYHSDYVNSVWAKHVDEDGWSNDIYRDVHTDYHTDKLVEVTVFDL